AAFLALGLPLACSTVDLGPSPAEVNLCRPSAAFFTSQVWPNFLSKDYSGKHCYDARCHDAASGRQLVLTPPTSMPGIPLPPDWQRVWKSASEQMQCTDVRASPLLSRPDGQQTHGGGMLISPDGPEAALVL